MKFLNEYTEVPQTELFNKYGVFFTFSNKQFDEAKKEGVKYISMGSGMICPKEHVKDVIEGMDKIYSDGIKTDIAENGKDAIIKRELYNYESFCTGDIERTVDVLKAYNITEEEIQAVYNKERACAYCDY